MLRVSRFHTALLASSLSMLAVQLTARPALADDRDQCVSAADKAQVLRDEGKYTKAREQMLLCSRDVCPGLIKKDCVQWLGDMEKSAPTVVVSARDGERDLSEVRVFLDGTLLAERLDGKPILVDPGSHKFRFEHSGIIKEQEPIIRAGEKNRIINVQFGANAPATAPLEQPGSSTASSGSSSIVPAAMLGGVGVIALGTAGFFWISGLGDKSTLEDTCGKTKSCTDADISPARTKLIVGDIAGGVGVVSLVVAGYLFLSRSKGEVAVSAGKTGFNVAPVPGGAAATYGVRF